MDTALYTPKCLQKQVNPDNSRAMSALTFLLHKLNALQTKIIKL